MSTSSLLYDGVRDPTHHSGRKGVNTDPNKKQGQDSPAAAFIKRLCSQKMKRGPGLKGAK